MSLRDSELDRLLAEWLEDDAFVAPASPVEAAVDFARSHPRRRDWLAFARSDTMTTQATTGLRPVAVLAAVAAVVLIGAAGATLIGSGPNKSPGPTATQTTESTPTATVGSSASSATPSAEPSIDQPSIAPPSRLLTIPVNNQSNEVVVLVVATDNGETRLAGSANPATVPAGTRRDVVFGVPPINQPEWAIFVNPGKGGGPILTQWDLEQCSGFIDIEIVIPPVGDPSGGPHLFREPGHGGCLSQ